MPRDLITLIGFGLPKKIRVCRTGVCFRVHQNDKSVVPSHCMHCTFVPRVGHRVFSTITSLFCFVCELLPASRAQVIDFDSPAGLFGCAVLLVGRLGVESLSPVRALKNSFSFSELMFRVHTRAGDRLRDRPFPTGDRERWRRRPGETDLEYERYLTRPVRWKSRYLSLHPFDTSRRTREPFSFWSSRSLTASAASRSSSNSTKAEKGIIL